MEFAGHHVDRVLDQCEAYLADVEVGGQALLVVATECSVGVLG